MSDLQIAKATFILRGKYIFLISKNSGRSLTLFFLRVVTISLGNDPSPGGLPLKSLWDTQHLSFTIKKASFCSYIKGSSNKKASYLSQRNMGRMNQIMPSNGTFKQRKGNRGCHHYGHLLEIMLLVFLGKITFPLKKKKAKKQIYLKQPFHGLQNVFVTRWTFSFSFPPLQVQATPWDLRFLQ